MPWCRGYHGTSRRRPGWSSNRSNVRKDGRHWQWWGENNFPDVLLFDRKNQKAAVHMWIWHSFTSGTHGPYLVGHLGQNLWLHMVAKSLVTSCQQVWISKFLSHSGVCSRRRVKELVLQGSTRHHTTTITCISLKVCRGKMLRWSEMMVGSKAHKARVQVELPWTVMSSRNVLLWFADNCMTSLEKDSWSRGVRLWLNANRIQSWRLTQRRTRPFASQRQAFQNHSAQR